MGNKSNNHKINSSSSKPGERGFPWKLVLIGALIGLGVGLWGWFLPRKRPVPKKFPFGTADYCKQLPAFIEDNHLLQPVYIDLSQRRTLGLAFVEASANGRLFTMPSWNDAGALGPYAMDESGNIYVAPIPYVSIEKYLPKDQSKIYRVDSKTGKMTVFIELPWAAPPGPDNPFNILGLAYDCDTKTLYVSTVTGSDYEHERGRIYQVDVAKGRIIDQRDNLDAIGIGVFNDKAAKYLYYGSARSSDIYRIKLGPFGEISKSEPEFVLSLDKVKGGTTDKCHRIRFFQAGIMELKGIDFNYTLHAESDVQRNIYRFRYDKNTGKWVFLSVKRQASH